MVWKGKLSGEELDLQADICNLGSGFLATDYMSLLHSPSTQGQKMRPNKLSRIETPVWILFYL